MEIKTEGEYQAACAEYELLKNKEENHDRKIELVDAIYEYEEKNYTDYSQDIDTNEGRDYDDFLRQEQEHKNL